jgi:hypothetical protein
MFDQLELGLRVIGRAQQLAGGPVVGPVLEPEAVGLAPARPEERNQLVDLRLLLEPARDIPAAACLGRSCSWINACHRRIAAGADRSCSSARSGIALLEWVESRTGAVALAGRWVIGVAFALPRSPTCIAPFPVPAHRTGRAVFRLPALRLASREGIRRAVRYRPSDAMHPQLAEDPAGWELSGSPRRECVTAL